MTIYIIIAWIALMIILRITSLFMIINDLSSIDNDLNLIDNLDKVGVILIEGGFY